MTTIDFSITNWVTVLLMVAGGGAVLTLAAKAWQEYGAK